MSLEPGEILKGVWFWDKRWWWVLAINELIRKQLKSRPDEPVIISVAEVNRTLNELGGSFKKRLRAFATFPVRVSIIDVKELILKQ